MTSLNTLEDDVIDTYYVAHINTTVVQLIFHFDFSIKDDVEIVVSVIIYDVCIYTVDVEMRNNVGGIYIVDVVFICIHYSRRT